MAGQRVDGMNRRHFLKTMFSLPVALGISEIKLQRLAAGRRRATQPTQDTRTGWINLNEVDENTLADWWADLNEFELPKEFGEIPDDVNAKDYLRGAFQILNAFTPEEAANQAWLRKMAPYLEEWERQKAGLAHYLQRIKPLISSTNFAIVRPLSVSE
jgi:hypothetical protein